MSADPQYCDSLRELLAQHVRNDATVRVQLRKQLEADGAVFAEAAVEILADAAVDSVAEQCLLSVFVAQGNLMSVLYDVHKRKPGRAERLAREAQRVDSGFAIEIVRRITSAASPQANLEGEDLVFLLQMANATNSLASVAASLRWLCESSAPRVRATAAVFGAGQPNGKLIVDRLAGDSDARVRANVVEALWSAPPAVARPYFLAGQLDHHHRVRANALVGLYKNGEIGSLQNTARMAASPAPLSRAAARWAISQMDDPRLHHMWAKLSDGTPPYEGRQAGIVALPAGRDSLDFHLIGALAAPDGRMQVRFTALALDSGASADLEDLAIQSWWNGEPVLNYEIVRHESPNVAVSLGLPVPAGEWSAETLLQDPLAARLQALPQGDVRACTLYTPSRDVSARKTAGDVLNLRAAPGDLGLRIARLPARSLSAASLHQDLQTACLAQSWFEDPASLARELGALQARLTLDKHILVRLEGHAAMHSDREMLSLAVNLCRETGQRLHAIAAASVTDSDLQPWAAAVRATDGFLVREAAWEARGSASKWLYAAMKKHYTLVVELPGAPGELRIDLRGSAGQAGWSGRLDPQALRGSNEPGAAPAFSDHQAAEPEPNSLEAFAEALLRANRAKRPRATSAV